MKIISLMKKYRQKKISVIIPAYNEENRIYNSLKKIRDYLSRKNYSFEIIVVDDGSRDNTAQVAGRIRDKRLRIIKYRKNQGKGYAVRTGMLAAKNNLALFCDADLSTPIEELGKFMKSIKDYDIIVGSRVVEGHKIVRKQPRFRVLLGGIFSKITRIVLPVNVQDTQCGFKLFKNCKPIFKKQTLDGWAFDVEILFIARQKGTKILEIPVIWNDASGSKLNPFRDSLKMLLEIARIKINSFLGRY